jgi:3-isopropylmalate dehydrogenase
VGAILSVALMLEHSFRRPDLARAVEAAVALALAEVRTPDVGGDATTSDVTAVVHRHLSWLRWGNTSAEEASSTEWAV